MSHVSQAGGVINAKHADELNFVMISVKPWNPYIELTNNEGRNAELAKLEQYLIYIREKAQYVSKRLNAEVALEDRRRSYIVGQLQLFDRERAMRVEDTDWGWSPLFRILSKEISPGVPTRPWKHTQEELHDILSTLQADMKGEPMSLELDCPHIVRALKLYRRISFGRCSPISHPITGMTRRNMLAIAKDDVESKRLSACAQDVVDIGWALFPCIFGGICAPIRRCWGDMLGLMGFEGWNQDDVLETIEIFLNRVARRAIVDLHRSGKYSAELAAMWWRTGSDDPAALRAHCNEVSVMNEGVSSPMCGQ
jgi:hypothetical protein